MPSSLSSLARLSAVTERRLRVRDGARVFFLGAIPTLLAAAGHVLAVKLAQTPHGVAQRALFWTAIGFGAGTLLATALVALRRLPRDLGATLLDRTFDNHDRLASALAFARNPRREPLMDAAIDDALAHAARLDPRRAVPVLPAFLQADAAIVVVLLAGLLGLSGLQWSRRVEIPRAPALEPIGLSPDDLAFYAEAVREIAGKDPSPETKAAVDEMNKLIEDIAKGRLDRSEAFRRLEALEKGLLAGREEERKAVSKALEHVGKNLKDSPLSKPVGEALEKKDLQLAKKELQELAKRLRDAKDKKKLSEAEKQKLRDALKKASEEHKKDVERLRSQREELAASLLRREQKPGSTDEERRLLQRDRRELDRLDREIESQERAQRELDRLDRELQQAAEDLLRELGDAAKDLERGAEDIDRMAKEELTDKEKEELRQRLQELREQLRQAGKSSEERKKALEDFLKKAKGKKGKKGKKGGADDAAGGKGKGKDGEGGDEGDEDEDAEDGSGKSKKPGTEGQDGDDDGDGEDGQGKGKKKGKKKSFTLELRPGAGSQPGGPGADGQGSPGGAEPGGGDDGAKGGKEPGTGHDPNVKGKATGGKYSTHDVQETATDTGQGPSVSETILDSSAKGFVGKKYKRVYADYKPKAEEAMKNESIPPGHKFYIQRYFQLIRPRE